MGTGTHSPFSLREGLNTKIHLVADMSSNGGWGGGGELKKKKYLFF